VGTAWSTNGGEEEAFRILVGKPEGNIPLVRPRCRWVDNIKMHLKRDKMVWYGLDRSSSGYGPVEGSCQQGNEPSRSIKCWEILE
jgi:hypothetical protein